MSRKLSEMSLEELWELFPIILEEHKDEWKTFYSEDEKFLKDGLTECGILRISHIGSTAIKEIAAKPIVDILVEIAPDEDMRIAAAKIENCGYICMSRSENRISYNKGYTENGFAEKVFHLHLRFFGDNDELYFRDYMNDNPSLAREYAALKIGLSGQFRNNRDSYTEAKTDFVKKYTEEAKKLYGDKYGRSSSMQIQSAKK